METNQVAPEKSPLEQWLAEIGTEANSLSDVWDPGFDGGRQIVIAKLGPFQKTFQRPLQFTPHFYHEIFSLPVDEWRFNSQIKLYGDFCTIDAMLTVRFQATIKYAQTNIEALATINQHIKSRCESLVRMLLTKNSISWLMGIGSSTFICC